MPFDVVPVARLLYSPSAILWWIINSAPSGPQAGSWRPYVKPAIVPAALHVSWQFLCCGYPGCSQNIKRSFSLRLCKFEVDAWYLYFEQLPKCFFTEIKDVVVTLLDGAQHTPASSTSSNGLPRMHARGTAMALAIRRQETSRVVTMGQWQRLDLPPSKSYLPPSPICVLSGAWSGRQHLASLEVLYNILQCYIAFRVCYIGKTGIVYSICCIPYAIYT